MKYVVIGASAGGIDALKTILPAFRKGLDAAVLVVIHLPPEGPNLIPEIFQDRCEFKIKEAEPGEIAQAGTIYIAAPDYHLNLEPDGSLSLTNEEAVNHSRPSIDILFESAAFSRKEEVMGILLTGANNDGANGLFKIQRSGGITLVQAPGSSEFSAMPQSALDIMQPDHILDLEGISRLIASLSHGEKCPTP